MGLKGGFKGVEHHGVHLQRVGCQTAADGVRPETKVNPNQMVQIQVRARLKSVTTGEGMVPVGLPPVELLYGMAMEWT